MGETKGRLFLIDGTALAYKSHFAFRSSPLTDKDGRNISAVYGFFNTLFSLIEREKPDMLAIAFDTKAPTFRHRVYPDYKATRQKMPEDMADQLPILYDILRVSGIKILEEDGLEADDLIGSAAKEAAAEGFDAYIVTGDKDFFQLVSDKIKVFNLRKKVSEAEVIGPAEVEEKFGAPPDKIIDVLGLMGDSSDNVPGVKGIGPMKAINLIKQFGSIENIYHNIEKIKGRDRDLLERHQDSAMFSRELVTIKSDHPVNFQANEWKLKLNTDELSEKFRELQFFSLLKYIGEREAEDKSDYHKIDIPEKLSDLVKKLSESEWFAFDTETTSEQPMMGKLVGLSFSMKSHTAYYVPCNDFKLQGRTASRRFKWFDEGVDETTSYILAELRSVLEDPSICKTAQNAKYDITILKNYGICVDGLTFDTMIANYLMEPGARSHNLDSLALRYLKKRKIPTSDLIGRGVKQITMDKVPVEKVTRYACEDADCTYRLKVILEKDLERNNLSELMSRIEIPLIYVLATMERNGVALDVDFLNRMSNELAEEMRKLEDDIYRLARVKFNINSPKQLSEILFTKLNLPVVRKTKTGYSTDESVLSKLAKLDPLPAEMLKYRGLAKLKSTYTDALPKMINPKTGRVHTSYNQTVTATGRLSSTDPNLQNIPVRSDTGGRIRMAFIPGKQGWKILSADYSQIELRVLAHLSDDDALKEAFRNDEDIHRKTAAKVFNSPPELVTPDMRRTAKEVNFGVIYGMRDFGLSERLGIPRKLAKEFIDNYFDSYPKVLEFIQNTIELVRKKGFVETIMGRRRALPEINSKNFNIRSNAERIAVNTPIQGSAADLIKMAMINIHHRIKEKGLSSMMIMQVHDELIFEVPREEMETMKRLVVSEMENALELSVPIKVDANFGDNWLEAH